MTATNFLIDDELKQRSFAILERLGVTPSELLHQTLEYVAENGKLPFDRPEISNAKQDLITVAAERLASPQRFQVSMDHL